MNESKIVGIPATAHMSKREFETFKIYAKRMHEVHIITQEQYEHLIKRIDEMQEQIYSPSMM